MANVDPWDIKKDDERKEDGLRTFIIFCEDENSEPLYFRSFGSEKIKINAISNQKQGKLNLINAIDKCTKEGLMVFTNNSYSLSPDIAESIWCVYDRDVENQDLAQIPLQNHLDFNLAIQTGQKAGLNIAWSNDAFELWVLLHFEDVSNVQFLHRDKIFERLTNIFKTLQPRTLELNKITDNPHFNYKTSFKRREYFLTFVLPLLKSNFENALERATALENQFNPDIPFHERNPCTMVHHLIKNIIIRPPAIN